jgi:hypothetical protein
MMASQISASGFSGAYAGQTVQKNTQTEEQGKTQESGKLSASALATQNRHQAGVAILQASSRVSISAGDQPQSLLYRSVVDRINEQLGSELSANAVQKPAVSQDNSPEATADRILSFSTGLYETYAQQHPGEDPEKVARNFVDVIRGGFEKGFNEAKDILEGLQVFNGGVAEGVMKTYDLVSKGYDQFLSDKLATMKLTTEGA